MQIAKSPFKLVWNMVESNRWQAGGLNGHYEIIRLTSGCYSLTRARCKGVNRLGGNYASLDKAKAVAQEHFNANN